jgi:hypothetical protein
LINGQEGAIVTQPLLYRRFGQLMLASQLIVGIAGCSGKTLFPIRGRVEYKDGSDVSVLAGGRVLFDPADPEVLKQSARGTIQKDGSFQMSTYREGDGVPPGKYRVLVATPKKQLLNPRYREFATSGLEITVTKARDDYKVVVEK